jgi:hypothetical protein
LFILYDTKEGTSVCLCVCVCVQRCRHTHTHTHTTRANFIFTLLQEFVGVRQLVSKRCNLQFAGFLQDSGRPAPSASYCM